VGISENTQQERVTIILTTHYLEEAEQLCKNVAIIHQGNIVKQGEIKTLLATMEEETVIFDLDKDIDEQGKAALSIFIPSLVHQRLLSLKLAKTHNLNSAVLAVNALGAHVTSMRNKTNVLRNSLSAKPDMYEPTRSLDIILDHIGQRGDAVCASLESNLASACRHYLALFSYFGAFIGSQVKRSADSHTCSSSCPGLVNDVGHYKLISAHGLLVLFCKIPKKS